MMPYLTRHVIAWERIAALGRAMSQACGAVVTFTGVVRPDHDGARTVASLDYEAYDAMAERELDRLVLDAQARWPLTAVSLEHRIGAVEVGQISVAVVVAAPHRADAYAASRFLMDELKRVVPIWKRTRYDDGTSAWASCTHEHEADALGAMHACV